MHRLRLQDYQSCNAAIKSMRTDQIGRVSKEGHACEGTVSGSSVAAFCICSRLSTTCSMLTRRSPVVTAWRPGTALTDATILESRFVDETSNACSTRFAFST